MSGAFFPADIAQDAAAARLFISRVNPYSPAIREAQASLTGLALADTFPHFPHPPFSLIVSLPLGFMTFSTGAAVWFGFTVALVLLLGALLAEFLVTHRGHARRLSAWTMSLLLLAWPPVLYNLEKGQWSVLLAVLLAFAARAIHRGESGSAARWAAVAAAVKVFPVLAGAYFLLRSGRAFTWFTVAGLLLTALPLLWIGIEAFPAFVRETQANMPYWESFPSVMFSLHGVTARLLVGGQWAKPLVQAPVLALALDVLAMGALLGSAVRLTRRSVVTGVGHALTFSAWLVLLPLLNPQSLGHNGVLLAVPLVIVARRLSQIETDWRHWAWAASLALVSIPKATVWRYASPPVGPLDGLFVVGLPAWGGLLLFGITASLSRHLMDAAAKEKPSINSGKISASPQEVTSHV